jgi:hypothetical protein
VLVRAAAAPARRGDLVSRRKARPRQPPPRPTAPAPALSPRRGKLLLIMAVVAGLTLAVGGLLYWQGAATTMTPPKRPISSVTFCTQQPPFARSHGFNQTAVLDTQGRTVRGLLMYQPGADGRPAPDLPPYQHPSWSSAGYLGPPVFDRDGAVYVAPAPWINTLYNPPERANTIYRIDPQTAQMTALLGLPPAAAANEMNAYGILAMTYDCDTHSLYVSSVYGSTRTQEHGRLFRVDLASKQATLLREGLDAFGLAVFNGAHGKRLYYGLARVPAIYSIALDASGNATSDPRLEADFAGRGQHGDERARRLLIDDDQTMLVRLIQFDFTLAAPTDPRQTSLVYRYDPAHDRWSLQDTPAVN